MQDIEPLHALVAAVYVTGDIAFGVPHVETRPAGVGKHVEDIALGLVRIKMLFSWTVGLEGLFLEPVRAPFFFDCAKIVCILYNVDTLHSLFKPFFFKSKKKAREDIFNLIGPSPCRTKGLLRAVIWVLLRYF